MATKENYRIATHSTNDGRDYYSIQKKDSNTGRWIEDGSSSPSREELEAELKEMFQ